MTRILIRVSFAVHWEFVIPSRVIPYWIPPRSLFGGKSYSTNNNAPLGFVRRHQKTRACIRRTQYRQLIWESRLVRSNESTPCRRYADIPQYTWRKVVLEMRVDTDIYMASVVLDRGGSKAWHIPESCPWLGGDLKDIATVKPDRSL